MLDAIVMQTSWGSMPNRIYPGTYDRTRAHLWGKDGHPDPLVISSDYRDPPEGWWCISPYVWETMASMIVVTAYPPESAKEFDLDMSHWWWHPDETYAREIVRQIITEERAVFTSRDPDEWVPRHPSAVQLSQVRWNENGWSTHPVAYCAHRSRYPAGDPLEGLHEVVGGVQYKPRWRDGDVTDTCPMGDDW
jgi:hypothetical protein